MQDHDVESARSRRSVTRSMTSALTGLVLGVSILLPIASRASALTATPTAPRGGPVQLANAALDSGRGPGGLATRAPLTTSQRRPVVVTSPRTLSVTAGATVRLVARAKGRPSPREQWFRELRFAHRFMAIRGATGAVLVLKRVTTHLDGTRYRAVFTNVAGHRSSRVATLMVRSRPVTPRPVTTPPLPTTPAPPTTTVTPAPAPAPVSVTPSPTVTTPIPPPAPFSVPPSAPPTPPVVPAPGPSSTPSPVIVTLNPQGVTVTSGASASFNAAATGSPSPGVTWQYSSNAGATYVTVTGATSTTLSVSAATISMNGYLYRAVFTNSLGSATTTAATLSVTAALVTSNNWAGYVATPGSYSHASGTFTVPTASCTSSTTYASIWVGIDGMGSPTVEQDGVTVECNAGTATYGAWYEMYGDTNVNCNCYSAVPLANTYPVSPGDEITASVDAANTTWTLSLVDATANWSFTITISNPTPTPAQTSAEWIFERPMICSDNQCTSSTLATLTATTPVTFTRAQATAGAVTASIIFFPDVGVAMATGSPLAVSPGPLSTDGTSFDV